LVGDPFETGFESDGCRSIHDAPAIPFVTRCLKNFSAQRAFDAPSGIQENMSAGHFSVASSGKCAPQQSSSFGERTSNYQTREHSGEDGLT
jgi:hypothetical protein